VTYHAPVSLLRGLAASVVGLGPNRQHHLPPTATVTALHPRTDEGATSLYVIDQSGHVQTTYWPAAPDDPNWAAWYTLGGNAFPHDSCASRSPITAGTEHRLSAPPTSRCLSKHLTRRYLPLPAEAASALFQVVSQRCLKTSIILTSNKASAPGAKSSATPPSPPPYSTGSCTAP